MSIKKDLIETLIRVKTRKLSSYRHFLSGSTSATVGFLGFPSAAANLHNIHKVFKWTHVSINVSKYNIHAGYILVIERD